MTRNMPESYGEARSIAFSVYNYGVALVLMLSILYISDSEGVYNAVIIVGVIIFTSGMNFYV